VQLGEKHEEEEEEGRKGLEARKSWRGACEEEEEYEDGNEEERFNFRSCEPNSNGRSPGAGCVETRRDT